MLNFLGKRILQLIPTLFFVSILIFSLQQLLPGDPALVMAGEERDPNVIAQIRQQYRLDQPVPIQYVYWVKGVVSGDFGESLRIKLQVLESDYVRTARAKGLSERSVILKHAMRNALTPIITLGALELGTLLSGAVLTEQIFSIPGFGKLIVDAVFNRDYAVVQGVVLVTATIYITLNLIADIAYILVNPRLRA